jgi:hypothetical protein
MVAQFPVAPQAQADFNSLVNVQLPHDFPERRDRPHIPLIAL